MTRHFDFDDCGMQVFATIHHTPDSFILKLAESPATFEDFLKLDTLLSARLKKAMLEELRKFYIEYSAILEVN